MKITKNEIKLQQTFPFQINAIRLTKADDRKEEFHWHSFFEITYLRSGAAVYYVNERFYEVEAGDFVIFNNTEPHGWEIKGEEMEVLVMVFSGQLIVEKAGDFNYDYLEPFVERGSNFENMITQNSEGGRVMALLMEEIYREWTGQAAGYRLMVKADVLKILTLLTRNYTDTGKSTENLNEKKSGMKRLEGVLAYMHEHYADRLTLEEMSRKSFMSPSYFSAYFKKVTGSTFVEYLAGIRIREVQRLLRISDIGVMEAAIDCGFNNISNFYRIYKKVTGENPRGVLRGNS